MLKKNNFIYERNNNIDRLIKVLRIWKKCLVWLVLRHGSWLRFLYDGLVLYEKEKRVLCVANRNIQCGQHNKEIERHRG